MTGKQPSLTPGQLTAICKLLGDTDSGLTGDTIGRVLRDAKIRDVEPGATKWKRLHAAICASDNHTANTTRAFNFIKHALDPGLYFGNHAQFEERRTGVNAILLLSGLELREDGKFGTVTAATTLKEAESRANRLRAALSARGVHGDVIAACRTELVQQNVFHAVLEASKSVAQKLRTQTGLTSDGAILVDEALAGDNPLLRINGFATDSEKSEQRGFANLLKGLLGVFRNPTAHAPRLEWQMREEDALDLFTFASYAHRRIDRAVRRP
jgi:uncharacterized protein (TIGR02391 family)